MPRPPIAMSDHRVHKASTRRRRHGGNAAKVAWTVRDLPRREPVRRREDRPGIAPHDDFSTHPRQDPPRPIQTCRMRRLRVASPRGGNTRLRPLQAPVNSAPHHDSDLATGLDPGPNLRRQNASMRSDIDPASTRPQACRAAARATLTLSRQAARNHEPLDVACSLVDLADPNVPVNSLHRIVRDVAVPAQNLDGIRANRFSRLRCE